MASTTFSQDERHRHIESIEKQVKYIEEDEYKLKTKMSKDEEKALKEEAKNLQKPVQLHRRLFNVVTDLLSDKRLKREAYSLKAQERRAELLTSKDVKLVQSENNRDEIRIVLNGKSGKGKSALGNNLLGYDQFTSKASLKGITMKCKYGVRYLDKEYKLLVVDTPGLFDSEKPNEEMGVEITKCVALAAPGPNIFIFVVSTERFSPEEKETLNNLQKLFGENVIDHVIIVFTKKEHLEDVGITEFMRDADDILLDLLVKCKFRFAFINNRADPDDVRVDIDVILDLIFKTIGENDGAYYTNTDFGIVDDAVGTMIKKKEKEKEKEIQQLKEQKSKLMDERQEDAGFIKASERMIKEKENEREPQQLENEKRKPRDKLPDVSGFVKVETEIGDVGAALREISIFLKQINIGNDESGMGNIEEKYENIQKLFYDQSKTDSESSDNEYISILISDVRNLKQNVNDLMTFLRENKTRKSSRELIKELNSEFDKIMRRMDSMEGKMSMSQTASNTIVVNPRIVKEIREIDRRIIDTQNVNVYYEVKKEIEKDDTNESLGQTVKKAAAGAPIVTAGAGVVAAASWLNSWW